MVKNINLIDSDYMHLHRIISAYMEYLSDKISCAYCCAEDTEEHLVFKVIQADSHAELTSITAKYVVGSKSGIILTNESTGETTTLKTFDKKNIKLYIDNAV